MAERLFGVGAGTGEAEALSASASAPETASKRDSINFLIASLSKGQRGVASAEQIMRMRTFCSLRSLPPSEVSRPCRIFLREMVSRLAVARMPSMMAVYCWRSSELTKVCNCQLGTDMARGFAVAVCSRDGAVQGALMVLSYIV